MWDSIFEWVGDNSKNLANVGQFASPVISGIGSYMNYDLAKDTYGFNKSRLEAEDAVIDSNNNAMSNGFDSIFGQKKKKNNTSTATV